MKTTWIVSGLVIALSAARAGASGIESGAAPETNAVIETPDIAREGTFASPNDIASAAAVRDTRLQLRYYDNYATVDLSTGWIEACDMEEDGNGVSALVSFLGGEMWVGDSNGSKGGCGNDYVPEDVLDYPEYISLYICEDGPFSGECMGPVPAP